MDTSKRTLGNLEVTLHTVKTLVIGAGVTGLNAAEHLFEMGEADVAIVTDNVGGASSDPATAKAIYYRMGMAWETPDSPRAFAQSLCENGMTHGDLAYIEAVNSIPEFLHLVSNGVPFPQTEYGTYAAAGSPPRAASAGPRTSAVMAEKSMARVKLNKTAVLTRHEVIALLASGEGAERRVVGAVAVDLRKAPKPADAIVVFNCENVVLATGGPGALYRDTVYSAGALGSHGLALKIGAAAANLTETRFGLAFSKARRPIAGNCQRAIPSYYSVGKGGRDTRGFLADYFHATRQIASAIFLKGEHWAFSAPLLQGMGPSIIDLAIYNEIAAGRHVFADFSQNVKGENIGQFNISQLDPAAREFLERSGATQFSPFDRLRHLDRELIDVLLDRGIDLREPQEVAMCAEDTFGGLAVDAGWETNVRHLFAVGDVACTHGNPPEGSGLNAGQVGGLRAARRIARNYGAQPMPIDAFLAAAGDQITAEAANLGRYVYGPIDAPSVRNVRSEIQARTSSAAAMVRNPAAVAQAIQDARKLYDSIRANGQRLSKQSECVTAVENELLCLTQIAVLQGIQSYIEHAGGSRGAYVIVDERGDAAVLTKRGSELRNRNENLGLRNQVIEVRLKAGTEFEATAVPARPIPREEL